MGETYTTGPRRQWRSEEFAGFKPTIYDWCRMAAFIDGEGGVQVNPYSQRKNRGIVQCRVLVTNTNPALPIWLSATFGGNVVFRESGNPKWADRYTWSATAGRACWILFNCLPWMLLKKSQAELLLELQERIDQTRQGRNRTLSETERDYRVMIHEKVKLLNVKGPKNKE